MAKSKMLAIQKAKNLEAVAGDVHRFYRTGEKIKAQYKRADGYIFYKFFNTKRDFEGYTRIAGRYMTSLIAYYEYKGDYKYTEEVR